MKRLLSLLLILTLVHALFACGKVNVSSDADVSTNTQKEVESADKDASSDKNDTTNDKSGKTEESSNTASDENKSSPNGETSGSDGNRGNTITENKDSIVSENVITESQKADCSHKNLTLVPNDKSEVPTCTKSGYYLKWCPDCLLEIEVFSEALEHTGGVATCVTKAKCTSCQNEYGSFDKNNHKALRVGFNDNAYAATCEKEGYEGDKSFCSACNTTVEKGKTIPALKHKLSSAIYDKDKDKIKEACSRSNCNFAEYTDIEPLSIKMTSSSVNIYGGFYPDCKAYITSSGVRKELTSLKGWPASADISYRGYYFNYSVNVGDIVEIQAFDKSGRSLTKTYSVIGNHVYQEIK